MIHVMLPTQYLRRADSHLVEPHRRLMAAVLQTVVDDCGGSAYWRARGYRKPIARHDRRKATAYVASRDRTWSFSFENLCEALGLDARRLRRELQTIPVFALPDVGASHGMTPERIASTDQDQGPVPASRTGKRDKIAIVRRARSPGLARSEVAIRTPNAPPIGASPLRQRKTDARHADEVPRDCAPAGTNIQKR